MIVIMIYIIIIIIIIMIMIMIIILILILILIIIQSNLALWTPAHYYGPFSLSLGKESPYIFSKFNPVNTDTFNGPHCAYLRDLSVIIIVIIIIMMMMVVVVV